MSDVDGELKSAIDLYKLAYDRSTTKIAELEAELSMWKLKRETILTRDLVDLFQSNGLSSLTFSDGSKAEIKKKYSVKVLNQDGLYQWFTDNGMESIIKDFVRFGKGEFGPALESYLLANKYHYTKEAKVETQTRDKAIRDHYEGGGDPIPEEVGTVSIFNRVEIKSAKD
jgi:hypothetical protein